jgi:hypothetical protein
MHNYIRPVYLKQEIYDYMMEYIKTLTPEELKTTLAKLEYNIVSIQTEQELVGMILDNPTPLLCHIGLLTNRDWLTNLAILLEDDVEYWITGHSANQLVGKDYYILLTRLIDKKEIIVPRHEIENKLYDGTTIDYLESAERRRKGLKQT